MFVSAGLLVMSRVTVRAMASVAGGFVLWTYSDCGAGSLSVRVNED